MKSLSIIQMSQIQTGSALETVKHIAAFAGFSIAAAALITFTRGFAISALCIGAVNMGLQCMD